MAFINEQTAFCTNHYLMVVLKGPDKISSEILSQFWILVYLKDKSKLNMVQEECFQPSGPPYYLQWWH